MLLLRGSIKALIFYFFKTAPENIRRPVGSFVLLYKLYKLPVFILPQIDLIAFISLFIPPSFCFGACLPDCIQPPSRSGGDCSPRLF